MIDCTRFLEGLDRLGVDFHTGVPDSLLKSFCACVADTMPPERHVTAANEGGAIALAAGHYLATGRPALVYMQNSGLGNAVNPLASLADPAVYGLPMLLLIGWRGEPGVKDEPQHAKQGAVTPALCDALGLPWRVLPADTEPALACLEEMLGLALEGRRPAALVVRKGSFADWRGAKRVSPYALEREAAVECIARALPPDAAVVATTGHVSRELYECRDRAGEGHGRDFLTVGSMGHASQIALGIALAQPERPVICLDGDGALLMHMGALAIAGTSGAGNLWHIVLNNGVHGSVGGQKTAGFDVDFVRMAEACGYRPAGRVETAEALRAVLEGMEFRNGPRFLEVRVAPGARKDLGRPATSPADNKRAFMEMLGSDGAAGS